MASVDATQLNLGRQHPSIWHRTDVRHGESMDTSLPWPRIFRRARERECEVDCSGQGCTCIRLHAPPMKCDPRPTRRSNRWCGKRTSVGCWSSCLKKRAGYRQRQRQTERPNVGQKSDAVEATTAWPKSSPARTPPTAFIGIILDCSSILIFLDPCLFLDCSWHRLGVYTFPVLGSLPVTTEGFRVGWTSTNSRRN